MFSTDKKGGDRLTPGNSSKIPFCAPRGKIPRSRFFRVRGSGAVTKPESWGGGKATISNCERKARSQKRMGGG